ncbi:hypothetical protein CTAYLR_008462 [Chrysophaeum taylorii]|uniref:Uncharacterized protein n=1 Tax=Chrysophaeum taylorii TaxID=2483200 RepID=A0AAD7UB50_9STRA|nr:hypothetical protein CTAYLR_008462 [Chrysophaeum taylorii]
MDAIVPVISVAQVAALAEIHDPLELRRRLVAIFGATSPDAVVGDFYGILYTFARARGFSKTKMAIFLTICQVVFDADVRTNDPTQTMDASFKKLEALLLKHSVERPPYSVGIFDQADVAAIVDVMLHTYFRHWRLYKTCFTPKLEASFWQTPPFGVEVPAAETPPLDAFTPLEIDGKKYPTTATDVVVVVV